MLSYYKLVIIMTGILLIVSYTGSGHLKLTRSTVHSILVTIMYSNDSSVQECLYSRSQPLDLSLSASYSSFKWIVKFLS